MISNEKAREILDNAPEGATHFMLLSSQTNYYRFDGKNLKYWERGLFTYVRHDVNNESSLLDLRAQLETSVEWKPEVGDICECSFASNDFTKWFDIEVLFIGNECMFVRSESEICKGVGEFSISIDGVKFRKPLTPEQLAAKEREELKNDAFNLIGNRGWSEGCVIDVISAMINVGYRMTEGE